MRRNIMRAPREFDLAGLSPSLRTMQFTPAEVRRIEKAANLCGWRRGEGPDFARKILLRAVAQILREPARTRSRNDRGARLRLRSGSPRKESVAS